MASLTDQSIASSYEQLLHVDNNGGGNGTTLVSIKDGDNGTTFALQLSTDKVQANGTLTVTDGINFPDTQSASADANTLDDYEEGTWTTTIVGATSGSYTATSGYNHGRYTKVGNRVMATAYFSIASGTPAGTLRLSLPIAAGSVSGYQIWVGTIIPYNLDPVADADAIIGTVIQVGEGVAYADIKIAKEGGFETASGNILAGDLAYNITYEV